MKNNTIQVFSDDAGIHGPRLGQYVGIRRQFTRTINKKKILVAIYSAYDALGLIGSEYNGVVVLNATDMKVVMDGEGRCESGWFGSTSKQRHIFDQLVTMIKPQFLRYLRSCDGYRGDATL